MARKTQNREETPGPWFTVWATVAQAAEELRQRRAADAAEQSAPPAR